MLGVDLSMAFFSMAFLSAPFLRRRGAAQDALEPRRLSSKRAQLGEV